jgi:ethanolamine transporter EutH
MPAISQLSDDAQTAFGYQLVNFYQEGAIWTATGGVKALVPPTGYTSVVPATRAISSDGSASAGTLLNVDPDGFFVVSEQAYRWTSGNGVFGLGYLPGQDDSTSLGISSDGTIISGTSGSFFSLAPGRGHG